MTASGGQHGIAARLRCNFHVGEPSTRDLAPIRKKLSSAVSFSCTQSTPRGVSAQLSARTVPVMQWS